MWTACLVLATRTNGTPGLSRRSITGFAAKIDVAFLAVERDGAKDRPSQRNKLPNVASQMRVAFSNIALKTGSSSPGELEITFSTSEVAVCCSS